MASGSESDRLIRDQYKANRYMQGGVRLCSITDTAQNHEVNGQRKLSTFFGVIVPCCLSMFSVILFLRMGFIVGQAGLFESLAMLLLAYTIIGFTVLSVCAISTNGAIEGGGAYFMISRALGPEFGGAIGLMFFLANCASSALYIFGIVEALLSFFGKGGLIAGDVFPTSFWFNYLYGTAVLFICLIVSLVGANIYAKTTFLIFVVVMASIISVIISFFTSTPESVKPECSKDSNMSITANYTGLNSHTLLANLYPDFTEDYSTQTKQTFVTVFAVLFNGCTGIMAGANMSGDLKNPSRSIPVGTITACGITFFVYTLLVILISASTPREILQCNYSFLLLVNFWSPFVVIGVLASSLSAALSCLIGASRILLALARDDLFGFVLRPVTKTTQNGNPIPAVIATWFLVQVTLFAGKVNTIAPIVTIFFLFSYAAVDLACLALEWASAPNFRPTFKLFTWHTCLLGFLSCITMMFLVQPIYTSVSVLVLIVLLIVIHYRAPTTTWGYISQALIFHQVRKYLLMLDIRKEHVKFWRPQILLMVKNPKTCSQLIDFINSIKKSGLYVIGHVNIGKLSDMETDIISTEHKHWLNLVDELDIKAFVELTLSSSVREGVEHLIRISGLGGMKPNTLVLGFHDNNLPQDTFQQVGAFQDDKRRSGSRLSSLIHTEDATLSDEKFESSLFFSTRDYEPHRQQTVHEYVSIIADALKLQKNICIARNFDKLNKADIMKTKKDVQYIDVWPTNFLKPLTEHTSHVSSSYFDTTSVFLMQMACILNMATLWKQHTKLRIFLCVEPGNENYQTPGDQELEEFLQSVRIEAEIKQVTWSDVQKPPESSNELGIHSADPSIQTPSQNIKSREGSDNLHACTQPFPNFIQNSDEYLKSINSLIKSHLTSTAVTFLYLPPPPRNIDYYDNYLSMLTEISNDLGPTLFVHGLSHVISTTL